MQIFLPPPNIYVFVYKKWTLADRGIFRREKVRQKCLFVKPLSALQVIVKLAYSIHPSLGSFFVLVLNSSTFFKLILLLQLPVIQLQNVYQKSRLSY